MQFRAPISLACSGVLAAVLVLSPSASRAQAVALVEGLPELRFEVNGQAFTIARNPDPQAVIEGEFARTSRACPPFCIQPMQAAPGVPTLGELELIAFLRDKVATGEGVLLDARLPDWFAKGSIPSAVNVPFATLAPENPFRYDILQALGARPAGGGTLDFSAVPELVVFCNGAWSDQAPATPPPEIRISVSLRISRPPFSAL